MYEIYLHRFKTTGKVYIGKTCKGVLFRLKKHFNDAISGSKTKFHKAIVKYGVDDIETLILATTESCEIANMLEIEFIEKYDSYKNGYNMTLGGDGGDVFSSKTEEEKKIIRKVKSIQSSGCNNPKYSGYSDEELVDFGVQYFIENKNKIHMNGWRRYCKLNKLPMRYSNCRFDGKGYLGFIEKVKIKLTSLNIVWNVTNFTLTKEERYSKEVNNKISQTLKAKNVKNNKDN